MASVRPGTSRIGFHQQYVLRFSLLDSTGTVCFTSDAKADPRVWLPGEHSVMESVPLPRSLKPGEYIVAVGIVDPAGLRRPFLLAIDAPEKDGLYSVSTLRIK